MKLLKLLIKNSFMSVGPGSSQFLYMLLKIYLKSMQTWLFDESQSLHIKKLKILSIEQLGDSAYDLKLTYV